MATYPQGVTDFIPDYQPYQPDLTTTANVLQLKQTQYDQNWEQLNKVYGQIYNAQLTHDQSISNRDEMVKQIDFNLRRVSGLDLSLDQNVDQATQVFRPFYEDSNLMKDMAWSKNTSSQISMGESKKLSTSKEEREQYWAGGLREIDYKIQEFKDTPYEQLTSVPDVSYTPYINVSKAARELAEASNLSIDITDESADHRWLIRQKNGEPLIGKLQDLFYAELGSDPAIQAVFQTQAYLSRKNTVAGTTNSQEFNGDAVAAEKKYLSNGLTMLKNENEYQVSLLKNEKSTIQKNISKLENMVSNGTSTPDTEIAIANLKNALGQTEIRLKGSEEDLSLVSNNLNKTLTTTGGSSLSMDDLNDMRYRVDNAMASGLMQAEFDKAAETFAYTDYVYDKKANPFQVNLENHGYRMSEQNARAKAAWDLTLLKSGLKKEELMLEAKKDSGNYVLVEDADGNASFQKNPLLNMILPNKGTKARTAGGTDTKQVQEQIMDALGLEPKLTKTIAIDLLRELNAEGTLSDESILKIVGNKGLTNEWERSITKFLQNYVVDPDNDWTTNKYTKNSPALKRKTKENMVRQGIYETSLEREDRLSMEKEEKKKPSKERVRENLEKVSKADIDDLKPEEINGFVQRLFTELSSKQYRDMPGIKNNPKVESLLVKSFQLQDYAAFLNSVKKSKEETAKIIINRLDADGFKYVDQLFDENWDKRSEKEWKAFIASTTPDDLINSSGMTWSGFLTSATAAGTTAGSLGLIGGPLAGLTFVGGAIAGGAAYVGTGLMGWAYNSFIANPDDVGLANGKMSGVLKNSATDEYNAMEDLIKTAAAEGNKADWMLPVMGLPNGGRDGSGKYTANGAEIRMRSGVTNTDVYEPWAELQKIIYNTDLSQPETGAYVTLNGVNSPRVPSKEPEYGYDDLDNNAKIWKILSTRLQSGLLDKDSKIGDVSYTVSPIAGGEFGKASITITPQNVDWLKKYVKTDKNPNGILDSNAFNAILDNGLTLITDAESLLSSSVYRNSFQSRVEARVANAGREGVTYKDPLDPDYQITIKKNNITSGEHLIEEQWKLWNPNTKSDTLITNIYSLGSMGKNLERVRDNYFLRTVPVKKQQRQIVYEQNR